MTWGSRWIGAGLLGVCGVVLAGCAAAGGDRAPALDGRALAADLSQPPEPRLVRTQRPDATAAPAGLSAPPPPLPGDGPSAGATQQVGFFPRGGARVNVRAWVNGRPIFDNEVLHRAGPEIGRVYQLAEPRRSEQLGELFSRTLDQLIDEELMYQDAVKKLEKASPQALNKLKEFVDGEVDKQLTRMRQLGIPEEQVKEIEPAHRRVTERALVAQEYARNRIVPGLSRVTLEVIKEYYDAHQNEFQTVDKVRWQNVFLAAGPDQKHRTVADARRQAERLVAGLKTPADFGTLTAHDDGDAVKRGGEGLGQRRGEITPPLLEDYLFKLREGEIGPIVEMPSGVHLFRVVKRDYAGQLPLDDATQKQIRKKLENQLADREYKRIVRELKSRAIWRVEKDGP